VAARTRTGERAPAVLRPAAPPRHRARFRLLESEGRPDDFDDYEDLLYTAAVHAGWLADLEGASAPAEIPGVQITLRVPRR
jgi:hypothetical protein